MTLLLERHEVEPLLDIGRAVEVIEAAFMEQGKGHALSQAPTMLRVPNGALRIVQGALLESKVMGARLTKAAGFPHGGSVALLCDSDSGEALALMSYPFGTLRTGATVALATKLLAREDAEVLGLIGTGQNALTLLEGVMSVRSIAKIKVYSRDSERRNKFAEQAGAALDASVAPCADPAEVVQGSDILLVATNSKTPVFAAEAMEDGLHVNSMGRPSELAAAAYRRADLIALGDKHQELTLDLRGGHTQPLLELKEEEGSWKRIWELGDVVCGRGERKNREGITIFRESQGGWGDVALAQWIYLEGKRRGLGRKISL
jgi:ornithine cyclodeaminase/alanine dehydrogenase-like protein (mu-crystallin family)